MRDFACVETRRKPFLEYGFSRVKPGLQYDADDARDARGDAREDAQAGVIL